VVGTSQFFAWYFEGLGGIGGWVLFLIFYVAGAVWHVYDSQNRSLPAPGWRFGVILPGLLLLPTILFRFASADTQNTLLQYKEPFFYLGILGGIAPVMVALGYWITFRGLTGCRHGHPPYLATLAKCPVCVQERTPPAAPAPPQPPPEPVEAKPARPTVSAWLVDKDTNQSYQLYQGNTRIGRSRANNDITIPDPTVSREHILVREEDGHFTLYDRGATAGTLLNGRRVRGPEMLAHGDLIVIGDTELQFTTP
jgi:hypothetical protein